MQQRLSRATVLSIIATGLLSFMGTLVETSLNVTFATLTKQMQVNLATIQWLTTGYLLLTTLTMIASAHLIKRYPAKTLFLIAIMCFTLGDLLSAVAPSFPIILLGRLIQAFSTGLSIPLMFHIILTSVPPRRLATYNGMAAMLIALGPALGPTYGGLLTATWTWRMIFWLLLPLIVIVFFLGIFNLKLQPFAKEDRFDFCGFGLLALILFLVDYTFNRSAKVGFLSWNFWGLLLISVLLMIGFYVYNRHSSRHLVDFSIFKNNIVSWHLLGYFLLQFINIGLSFIIPQVAQYILGQNAFVAGMILLPGALLGVIVAPLAGRWMDRLQTPLPIVVGHAVFLLGAAMFIIYDRQLTVALLIGFYFLLRLGFNLAFGNTISHASVQVQPKQKADINATFNMTQQYAGSLGTNIFAAIIGVYQLQHVSLRISTAQGALMDYWLIAVLAIIGLFAAWISYRQTMQKK
ncbi:MFS transporter [Loigolactobacillus coryniformis]|uniref:MFS transporter n=1 Tax=Loigolactobacillus coryniformis TaxID=1610 RepID=UPI00201AA2FB|nr:MFS transporter [Loigolactobacillus coryniformis]MCL5459182.1 MFS transporter [Loigolactobacillus coryniformis]